MEIFKDGKYNIHENNDLRALERRLPKGWKKPKWTPRTFKVIQPWTPSTPFPRWARRSEAAVIIYTFGSKNAYYPSIIG
jgi:hypothetical protein